jgi:hypothetical protein
VILKALIMTVDEARLIDEDWYDVLPPGRSFASRLLYKGNCEVDLEDVHVLQGKAVRVSITMRRDLTITAIHTCSLE